MRKTYILNIILMSILLLNQSFAQNTIIADRPGIGAGSHVLDSGIFQIESGLEFSKSQNIKQYKLGQILLRYGINLFEMQASLNSFVIQNISGEKNNGLQDLAFALKVPLTSGTKFTLSLLPKLNLPLGANFLTSNEYIPSVILLGDYSINNYLTSSVNLGYDFAAGDAEDVISAILTNSISINEKTGFYFGYAGFFTNSAKQHFAEAGITILSGKNIQYDFNYGIDLQNSSYFIGIGLAINWEKI